MKKILLSLILILCLLERAQSQAFPNPATLSTGQGAPNTLDPLWLVSPWYTTNPPNPIGLPYSAALINNNCAPGSWVDPATLPAPMNNGNWITGSDAPCSANTSDGYRYFRLTLNLPADCNGNSVTTPGTYTLYLSGYSDNTISDVFINGNSTGISGGYYGAGGQLNMTLIGPWVVGINYVDVSVYNFPSGGGSNPYGLLLVANSTAYATADGDHDGVLDINDHCPCSAGSLANGCPAPIVGDTIICKGESTILKATGSGTYLWSTGSTNPSITVSPVSDTIYTVIVTTSGGSRDSLAAHVTVNSLPSISMTGDTTLCAGETTTLTAIGAGPYMWSTGSTNAAITVTPALTTNYKVVVTNANSCKDSVTKSVTVFPKPSASFTFTNKCNGTAVPFNSTSIISAPGAIASWNWDFGDNITGTGSTPSHTYSNPGNYNVTLRVTSNNSCIDSIVHQITIFNNAVVDFTHSDICLGDSMHFVNISSVNAPDSISDYLWNFDDASNTSNLRTAAHDYVSAGAYNVTLIATTTNGCSGAATHPVNVFDSPQSSFTSNNTCLLTTEVFTNTSVNPTLGTISNWSWDYGDGSALNTTVNSPSHLYSTPGNYQVTLITHSSNLGCADTVKSSITVFPMPVARFVFNNTCLNQAINFYDSSTVSSGTINNWSWNFGDGTPLNTLKNPNYIYTNNGTYTVSLVVTTNNGCKDSIAKTAVVHPLPVAQYSTANVCMGTGTQFNDLSHISITDTIQSWKWNFGDGTAINTNATTSHLYAASGSYPVQLWIASKFGCLDSITKISVVNPNPTVNFKGDDTVGCEPVCVNFQNLSTITLPAHNAGWLWTLDASNTTSTSENPSRCYNNDSLFAPISFNIILKVTSDSGCVSTKTKNNYITIYPKPLPGFSVQPTTASFANPVISITDLSSGVNFWNWNFGDNDTTTVHNPNSHTYADTGIYTIRQITSTLYSCADTAYQTITIEPEFLFYVPNAFTPNDDGINDTFTGQGIFIKEYQMSIFDRWGNLIFFSDDVNKPWDGKTNHGNSLAQQDVYVYAITVTDFSKRKHNYRGLVTLTK